MTTTLRLARESDAKGRTLNERGDERGHRFRAYRAYKDSGVDWLGGIPAHWEVKRIRHVVNRIEQGWSPECENREADEDEWGVLKAGCVNRGTFVESEHKALPRTLSPIPGLEIAEGDLLMSRASGSRDLVGSVAVVPKCRPRLLLCDKVFRLRVDNATQDRRFLAYALNSSVSRWQIEVVLSGGSGLANNIAQEVVKDLLLVQPQLAEQEAIAAFLDRATAQVDALMEKNLRLIALLIEKRAALIARVVTRGLNPKAAMKNSGVEWVAETPQHWKLVPLKSLLRRCDYGISESLSGVGTIPVLTMAHIQNGEVLVPEGGNLSEVEDSLLLDEGDLLFNRTNSRELVGKVGIFRGSRRDRITFASYLVRMTARHDVAPEWLNFVLNSSGLVALARSMALLSVNQANLNPTKYTQILVPLPPENEQASIAAHLRLESSRADALIAKVGEAIERLKELRTALISAAVTGKIDVREEAA
jgi:type I restriction enzyme S subunit